MVTNQQCRLVFSGLLRDVAGLELWGCLNPNLNLCASNELGPREIFVFFWKKQPF